MTASSHDLAAPAPSRGERVAWALLVAAAVAAFALLAVLVAQRLGYPYELEWMEGAMADEAVRVRHGLDLYGPPGVEHAPFLYTPGFYYLTALAMSVCGEGLAAARAVSAVATMACAWLLFAGVRAASGTRAAGLVAAGLLCAGYGWLRTWYDLGRSDMVFVAAILAIARLLQRGGLGAACLAGLVAVAAFWTKQTALLWLPWLAIAAVARDRRTGVWFAAVAAVGILAAVGIAHLATDGWSSFYVFEMPRLHGRDGTRWLGFWTEDLVPVAPLLLAAVWTVGELWCRARRREAVALGALCAGGVMASYASRLHVGGFDNVLLYAFAGACCTAPVGAAVAQSRRARAVLLGLLGLQFALLVVDVRAIAGPRPLLLYDPRAALPRAEHRQATEELLAFVRALPGEVWLPFHGHLGAVAGKRRFAHAQALYDLMPYANAAGPDDPVVAAMGASLDHWLRQRRLDAVVLESPHGALLEEVFRFAFESYVRRDGPPLLTVPSAIRPLVGMVTDAPYALVPRR